jgi:hypothetical protein
MIRISWQNAFRPLVGIAVGLIMATAACAGDSLPGDTLAFHRVAIRDTQGTGLDAFTMLVPDGWNEQAQVIWNLKRTSAPSDLYVRVSNPANTELFVQLPSQLFVWSALDAHFARQMGGQIQGCPIVRPVNGPIAAIQSIIIPQSLPGVRYSVVSSQELPRMAEAFAPTYRQPGQPTAVVRAGVMRIEYNQNGREMDQDIYCVFLLNQGPAGFVWGLDHIVAFKAKKGVLDHEAKRFTLMASSLIPTPRFTDAVTKVTNMLIQQFYQSEQALMARVAAEERAENEISAQSMAGWKARSDANFNAIDNWEKGAIRGVTPIKDSEGDVVDVPDDATHAWISGNEVVYTDNENFHPSQYKNFDWEQLK